LLPAKDFTRDDNHTHRDFTDKIGEIGRREQCGDKGGSVVDYKKIRQRPERKIRGNGKTSIKQFIVGLLTAVSATTPINSTPSFGDIQGVGELPSITANSSSTVII